MIDFKELPEDGILFEQLIRELLVLEGFEVHWTGVGTDGGRDLVLTETLIGQLSTYKRKWLISCKHTANSGKSVGRTEAGPIYEDCSAVGANGYILVTSTQPTSSLVTRLDEIEQCQGLITKYWDVIEIEKRLLKPHTFKLIHTFFPISARQYKWNIYNAFSAAFWAANYKDYFFYLSCRHSNKYPDLGVIEEIVELFEKVSIYKGEDYYAFHYLRLRAVYYDDKHCTHVVYLDYIYPKGTENQHILDPRILQNQLHKEYGKLENRNFNLPTWDISYLEELTGSDSFQVDHKRFYNDYLKEFEQGASRQSFLHDIVFQLDMLEHNQGRKRAVKSKNDDHTSLDNFLNPIE